MRKQRFRGSLACQKASCRKGLKWIFFLWAFPGWGQLLGQPSPSVVMLIAQVLVNAGVCAAQLPAVLVMPQVKGEKSHGL